MSIFTRPLLLSAVLLFYTPGAAVGADMTEQEKARLAAEVKAEFLHSWNAYKTYAWGHDGLKPLSKTHYDWYSEPLYMTPNFSANTFRVSHEGCRAMPRPRARSGLR